MAILLNPTYKEKKIVFLISIIVSTLVNIYILTTNIMPYEKILTFIILIFTCFLLLGIYNDDKRLVTESHDIFFYWLLGGVIIFQSKSIQKMLYIIYVIMLVTRLRYNKCLFREFDNSSPSGESFDSLTFNDKNIIMIFLSNILLYRIY